jgi:hypothetical protein
LYFVLLRITASGCTFGIFKLSFNLDFDDSLQNHIVSTYIRYVFFLNVNTFKSCDWVNIKTVVETYQSILKRSRSYEIS